MSTATKITGRDAAELAFGDRGTPQPRGEDALSSFFEKAKSAGVSMKAASVALTVLAIIAVIFALHAAKPITMPLTAAVVIGLILAPAADWLGRRGLPEGLRAGLVVFAALLAVLAAFYAIGRPAVKWSKELPDVVAEAREKLSGVTAAMTQVQEVSRQVEDIAAPDNGSEKPQEVVVREGSLPLYIAASARTAIIQILFTAVLTYFLLETKSGIRLNAIAARRTMRGKLQTARIFRNMQKKVGVYMFTMLTINLVLGAAVAASLGAIGMPSPLVWGLLAAFLNFVPYLGPAIVTILLALSGLVEYETLRMAAAPAAIYIALNFIESNFVTPSLIGVRLRVSPLAVLISIALFVWIWGPVGALLAIPLVIILKTVCDSVRFLRPLGVFIGDIKVVKGRKVDVWGVHTEPRRAILARPPGKHAHIHMQARPVRRAKAHAP